MALPSMAAQAADARIAVCIEAAQRASIPPRSARITATLVTRKGEPIVHLSWDDIVNAMDSRRHHAFECLLEGPRILRSGPVLADVPEP